MALLIDNDVTERVLTMQDAVAAMERVLKQYSQGLATFQPHTDLWAPTAVGGGYHRQGSLPGAMYAPPTLAIRFKSDIICWTTYGDAVTEEWHNMEPGTYCGFIILIDMSNGEIIGLMNDGIIQHARVGATAGVGAKYLSRENSTVLGVIGSGGMAAAYTELVIGSEQERTRRPGNKKYRRCYESNTYPYLADVIAGETPGRENDTESIYFDNNSAGVQFAAVGRVVYDKARERGLGMEIPMEWFQQDIRN